MRPPRALTLLASLPLIAAGCATTDSDSSGATADESVDVIAAFYPLQYVAQRVAGDAFEVENLTLPGFEAHELELTIRQTAALESADLVIHLEDFQPAVDDALETNPPSEVLEAGEFVDLLDADHAEEHSHDDDEHGHDEDDEHGHDEDEHHDDGDEHGHDDEDEHHDDEGHDHDHGDYDPHFWHDPIRMADLGDAIADTLADLAPDAADDFLANAAALRDDMTALDDDFATGLADCALDTVVVSHDAFGYLRKYDLHFESIAGLTPGTEPTPATLQRLQGVIRDEGITTVFYETLVSPRLAESLASDVGVETAVLDPIEGLTDETADEDYLSLMRANLAALSEANQCA